MRRYARPLFYALPRVTALPLSAMLLAALCVLLMAPASQAAPQKYSRQAILSVLQSSGASASLLQEVLAPQATQTSQLSAAEVRKLGELLSQLDKSQLLKIQKQLAAMDASATQPRTAPAPSQSTSAKKYSSPSPRSNARTTTQSTSRYLE
jgi:hypothetical protein